MKKIFVLALTLVMIATMFAFASAEETVKVYAVTPVSGGPAWGRFEEGFLAACEARGYEGHCLAPAVAQDKTAIVQLCESAVNNGADVLMMCANDPALFTDVLTQAQQRGVITFGIGSSIESCCNARVGTDNVSLGSNTATALVEMAKDEQLTIAVGMTALNNANQSNQVEAFKAKLAELAPNAVVVDIIECNSNASVAADKLSALYIAHPELNACVSFDSNFSIGAASFVADYGIADSFYAFGIDDGNEILTFVKGGQLDGTIAQQWVPIGEHAVQCAEDILGGKTIEYNQGIPTVIILSEDVDAYAAANGVELG